MTLSNLDMIMIQRGQINIFSVHYKDGGQDYFCDFIHTVVIFI